MRMGDRQHNFVHNDCVPLDLLRLNTLVRALFTRFNRSANLPIVFLVSVAAEPSCLVSHFAGCTVLRNLGSCDNMPCWGIVVGPEDPGFESRLGRHFLL